jgi:hypothetical protein
LKISKSELNSYHKISGKTKTFGKVIASGLCNRVEYMRNFLIILFFLLAGVASKAQQTIQDSLQQYLSEVQLTCSRHKTLWNIDLYGPILFVNPSTRKVFASEADAEGVLTSVNNIYTGALPPEVNIANTSLQWRGKR